MNSNKREERVGFLQLPSKPVSEILLLEMDSIAFLGLNDPAWCNRATIGVGFRGDARDMSPSIFITRAFVPTSLKTLK